MDKVGTEAAYRRYLDGDDSAFDEIQRTYFMPLTFYAARIVHDTDAAQDIAIEALLQLIIHKKRYRFGSSLQAYLYKIAHNKSVNYIKRNAHETIISEDMSKDRAEDENTLEEQLISEERMRAVSRAVNTLPAEMAEAIHLFYYADFSYEEIAKTMKKTRKQIDNLLYRAKSALRNILGEEGDLDD